MMTVLNFLLVFLGGYLAAAILLAAYENAHPTIQDAQLEKQRKEAFRKLCFRAGLIVAFIWLMYHWTPAFGD
jgi:hypothetical protein